MTKEQATEQAAREWVKAIKARKEADNDFREAEHRFKAAIQREQETFDAFSRAREEEKAKP